MRLALGPPSPSTLRWGDRGKGSHPGLGHKRISAPALARLLLALVLLVPTLFTTVALGQAPPDESTLLRVSVLDAGQGDAILVQSPGGKTVLIDAGPASGQILVLKQLQQANVTQFDLTVATHPHEDHIGGFVAILNRYNVRLFIDSGVVHTTRTYERLLLTLEQKQTPTRVARRGQRYKLDEDVLLEVLEPREPLLRGSGSNHNNNSVVTRITYRKFSMLLPGDAEEEAERRMLQDEVLSTVVLKAGHHGSRSSSTYRFLSRVDPKIAVISCGHENRYGHPHDETLTQYRRRQIKTYRTDLDGQVRVLSDGDQIWVETFSRAALEAAASEGVPSAPDRVEGPFEIRDRSTGTDTRDGKTARGANSVDEDTSSADSNKSASSAADKSTYSDGGGDAATVPSSSGYVSSKNSKVFHLPTCSNAKRISESNRVVHPTRSNAIDAGKRPAKCCNP